MVRDENGGGVEKKIKRKIKKKKKNCMSIEKQKNNK